MTNLGYPDTITFNREGKHLLNWTHVRHVGHAPIMFEYGNISITMTLHTSSISEAIEMMGSVSRDDVALLFAIDNIIANNRATSSKIMWINEDRVYFAARNKQAYVRILNQYQPLLLNENGIIRDGNSFTEIIGHYGLDVLDRLLYFCRAHDSIGVMIDYQEGGVWQ